MSRGICRGIHASTVVCVYRLGDIVHGLHASDVVCAYVVNVVFQWHHQQPRHTRITLDVCASVGRHRSWPSSIGQFQMTLAKASTYQIWSVRIDWAT